MTEHTTNEHENGQSEAASNIVSPGQRRCMSHQLNLVPSYFEKELSGRAKTAFISVMGKLQTIWVFPRRSSYAKKIAKEVLGCSLKLPCETRRNSKFDAIKHVYDLESKINPYIHELKDTIIGAAHLPKLSNDDWTVIVSYLKVMDPIGISLDKLQGYILPTIRTMRHKVNEVDGGTCTKSFKEAMLKVIDRRFKNYLEINECSRELVVAAICIPRFKADFIEDEFEVDVARKMLISECVKRSSQINPSEQAQDNLSSQDD